MQCSEIIRWLRETSDARLEALWRKADECRRERVGDEVHLRGLVEVSNVCARDCHYCGIRVSRTDVSRYRMSANEILECAATVHELGYGTIVLQAGEDHGIRRDWLAGLIRRIKLDHDLAITLSLGERDDADLLEWREAGADRYLLRFETSDRALFEKIHPARGERCIDRIEMLGRLREMGYEVGSGVMVGIPGQTYETLARDIELFRELDLDMIGIGPFVPHPDTPLGQEAEAKRRTDAIDINQVPADELLTYKVVALTRLICPDANLPSTTALSTINKANGRELGLMRGANIVMPNLTPAAYRCRYQIYPGKECFDESGSQVHVGVKRRIEAIGRVIGTGRGDSPNKRKRTVS